MTCGKDQINNKNITQITAFNEEKKKIWSIYTKHIVSNVASNSYVKNIFFIFIFF